jgi:hypothetical protein
MGSIEQKCGSNQEFNGKRRALKIPPEQSATGLRLHHANQNRAGEGTRAKPVHRAKSQAAVAVVVQRWQLEIAFTDNRDRHEQDRDECHQGKG